MGLFTSFQLKSRDADTRRRGALKLGVPGRRSAIPSLQPLLEDPEWPVREAAAQALGLIGDASAAPLLVEAIRKADAVRDADGASAVRASAVAALVQVGQPAIPALLDALRDRHAGLREAAIEALGSVGGEESRAALAAALGDDRSNVRQAAAPALARASGTEAVPALRTALLHRDPATRRASALALGTVNDDAAAEALRAATGDRDRGVREAALRSLAALASPPAVDALCTALLEGEQEIRAAASGALRSFAWTPVDARQKIVHAVLHGRYEEAAAQGDAAVPPLVAALADRDADTRKGVAAALGTLAHVQSAAALAGLLSDQDSAVRDAAVAGLARLGPSASPQLVRALDDRGPAREAATRAAAAVGEGRVAAALMAPLVAGQAAAHGGLPLRIVASRAALDAARRAADDLVILLAQLGSRIPADTLRALAAVEDMMLIEPGQRPDPDARASCDAIRSAAARELKRRGIA